MLSWMVDDTCSRPVTPKILGVTPTLEFTPQDLSTLRRLALSMRLFAWLAYFCGAAILIVATYFAFFVLPYIFSTSWRADRVPVLAYLVVVCPCVPPCVLLGHWVSRAATAFRGAPAGWSTLATAFRDIRKYLILMSALWLLYPLFCIINFFDSIS